MEKLSPAGRLYASLRREMGCYRDWLTGQTPVVLLRHASDWVEREDLMAAALTANLTDRQAEDLLRIPSPMSELSRLWKQEHCQYGLLWDLRRSIVEYTDRLIPHTSCTWNPGPAEKNGESYRLLLEQLRKQQADHEMRLGDRGPEELLLQVRNYVGRWEILRALEQRELRENAAAALLQLEDPMEFLLQAWTEARMESRREMSRFIWCVTGSTPGVPAGSGVYASDR